MARSRTRTRAQKVTSCVVARYTQIVASTGVINFQTTYTRGVGSDNVVSMERTTDALHPGPPYRSGGPFASYKSEYPWYQVQANTVRFRKVGQIIHKYEGGFVPSSFGGDAIPYADCLNVGISGPYSGPDFNDPSQYGAEAYKKFRPKTSGFDAATFLGELRDLPGMMKSAAKKFDSVYQAMGGKKSDLFMPKTLAGDYLEYNFGWVPFLSDLSKLYKTYKNYDGILRRLRRQNNQWVRKGGIVLETGEVTNRESIEGNAPYVWPSPPSALLVYPHAGKPSKWGHTTLETQQSQEIWFEGSFKYHIPGFNNVGAAKFSKVRNFMQVYGLRISPSVIYNLTPWSWLADYFGNLGDVIDNVTARTMDRLVSRYAYLMSRTRRKRLNSSQVYFFDGTADMLWSQSIDAKCRISASPFGFNLKAENLSAYQWSILGALGLSRGRS